jgi:hypothetical protein
LLSQLFDGSQSNIERGRVREDAPIGDDAKKAGETGIAEGEATSRFDLLTEPGREAVVLRKILTVRVDENVYVGEDHVP